VTFPGGKEAAYVRRREGLTMLPTHLLNDANLFVRLRVLDLTGNHIALIPSIVLRFKNLQVNTFTPFARLFSSQIFFAEALPLLQSSVLLRRHMPTPNTGRVGPLLQSHIRDTAAYFATHESKETRAEVEQSNADPVRARLP
jgi:hypothetical protein